uniref:Uncharacterized protein n=1 Tax=Lynx canadensis TaxID=61383 RepID=A0A667I4I4_LYNCA
SPLTLNHIIIFFIDLQPDCVLSLLNTGQHLIVFAVRGGGELRQVEDQLDRPRESQDQPVWQTAFADREAQKGPSGQEFTTFRKIIYPSTDFISVRQRLSKYYSWGRCSKCNLNFLYITKDSLVVFFLMFINF